MIEFIRMKNNKTGFFAIMSIVLCFVLGLFLLITLDGYKLSEISLSTLQYSIYTVFSQFGFFILPVIAIHIISNDYKEKNISFYKSINENEITYFIKKIFALITYMSIGIVISAIILAILYKNFSNILLFILKLENVSIFIVLISSLIAFLFKNNIAAFCINFGVWVLSVSLSAVHSIFKLLCFYDASLARHSEFRKLLNSYRAFDNSILFEIAYNCIFLIIALGIIKIFKKRWIRNGI